MIRFLKTAAIAVGLTYKITLTTVMIIGLARSIKENKNREELKRKIEDKRK
jgi:hypothetical protein